MKVQGSRTVFNEDLCPATVMFRKQQVNVFLAATHEGKCVFFSHCKLAVLKMRPREAAIGLPDNVSPSPPQHTTLYTSHH